MMSPTSHGVTAQKCLPNEARKHDAREITKHPFAKAHLCCFRNEDGGSSPAICKLTKENGRTGVMFASCVCVCSQEENFVQCGRRTSAIMSTSSEKHGMKHNVMSLCSKALE